MQDKKFWLIIACAILNTSSVVCKNWQFYCRNFVVDFVSWKNFSELYIQLVGKVTISFSHGFKKRRALSLEERVQVIKSSERGESSRSIAKRLGVGRTQIQNTIRGKLMCCQSLKQKTTQKENVKLHFVQYVGCTYIPLFITIYIHSFYIF